MSYIDILRSIDIEDTIRVILSDFFSVYVRPLPENFDVPSIEVQRVGGDELNKIDTFDVVLDARAEDDATADELIRNAIGVLKEVARQNTTPLRNVAVNSLGSWGSDPVRPDLAMCSARLRVTAHEEITQINKI